MNIILEGLLKGLVLWLYGLILDGVNYLANSLLDVFNMDLSYFETYAPVTTEIVQVIIATGWALLIGNLVFQATRSMAAGIGFEGEDPKILFTRTFVFSFLLVASRQICDIGLGVTATVMDLLRIPDAVNINTPDESAFGMFDSSWLLVVIVGIILIWQILKFFFEIGERYVVLAVLTIMAPLAFGMGGSKSTEDIFKGWVRMYGSMCVMMLMNVVFLKLLLSAMSTIPSGTGIIPWLIFVVAIARVGRKVDDLVCRVGLNPARTGDPLGRGLPVMVSMMVAKNLGKTLAATAAGNKQNPKPAGGAAGAASGSPRSGPTGPIGSSGGNGANGTGRSASAGGTTRGTAQGSGTSAQHNAAASAATGAAASAAGQAAHAAGQAPPPQRPPSGQTTRQESQQPQSRAQAGQRAGEPVGQGGQNGQGGRPPRTSPVNIDVECDDTPARPASGAAAAHAGAPMAAASGGQTKAAEPKPTRPPMQQTPRGNFPQAPVGAGATPSMSHSSGQGGSTTVNNSQSQTTQGGANSTRPAAPPQSPANGGTTAAGRATPPLSGAKGGAGVDRTTASSGASRPPIGHNATTVNSVSQESRPPSPGRNAPAQSLACSDRPATPSPGRDTATVSHSTTAQTLPPSPGRNGAPQSAPPSVGRNGAPTPAAPAVPPSPGRNGASAPQKPLSPPRGADRGQSPSPPPSPGRNSAPQSAPPPSQGIDSNPQRAQTQPPLPLSPGRNDPPKRPPIGHDRKPPQGS